MISKNKSEIPQNDCRGNYCNIKKGICKMSNCLFCDDYIDYVFEEQSISNK